MRLLPRLMMAIGIAFFLILSGCTYKHEISESPVHHAMVEQRPDSDSSSANRVPKKHAYTRVAGVKQAEPSRRSGLSEQSEDTVKKPMKVTAVSAAKHTKISIKNEKAPAITLDVLTRRLKQTDAIGVFTKLAIRSDIMDLKDDIQTYRRKSVLQSKLRDVRARFDGLLMKIMALLEADPDLSRDLYSARETIWKSLLGVKA